MDFIPGLGTFLAQPLAHIWQPLSPVPTLPHITSPREGTRTGVPTPRSGTRPGLTCCPGTVQGGKSQEGQGQLRHGCPRGGGSAGDCERAGTAGLYMSPFPLAPADSGDRLLARGAVDAAGAGPVSRWKREAALPGEPAARCRTLLQPGKLEGLFLQSC